MNNVKKTFLIGLGLSTLGVASYMNNRANEEKAQLARHDLMLENVESLTDDSESASSPEWKCWSALKDGDGVWVCGDPCQYERHKTYKKRKDFSWCERQ